MDQEGHPGGTPVSSIAVGDEIGHYRITDLLGRGGMGEVFKAEDKNLRRSVALKVLPPDLAGDPKRMERFQREAEAIAALNHPNIVTIYSIESAEAGDEVTPSKFLTMELVEGESLDRVLARGNMSPARTVEITLSLAEALAAAHGKGIVHRDLKPANVMLTEDERVKVLDFGLAKMAAATPDISSDDMPTELAALTQEGMVMGTAPYMSPEQARGQQVDARSDIFSLGCVVYEAVSGRRAFEGDTSIDTLHQVMHADPRPLPELESEAPAALSAIVEKTLAKHPAQRYQAASELVDDLRTLKRQLDSESYLADPTSQTPTRAGGTRRWSVPKPAAAGVLALLMVIAVYWVFGRGTSPETEPTQPKQPMSMRQLTSIGQVTGAAISPDGVYFTYSRTKEGPQSLNVRQVDGSQGLELVSEGLGSYWGQTFTPDGSAVIFAVKTQEDNEGIIYRISTLGGEPRPLFDGGVDSVPVVSPEGSRIAFMRQGYPEPDQSSLLVGDLESGNERVLVTVRQPELFVPAFWTAPGWSPDGSLIAASLHDDSNETRARIIAYDSETGAEEWVADPGWVWAGQVSWTAEGDGLVAIATQQPWVPWQVWFVSYPAGEAQRVTQDLLYYRTATVTADGRSLLTVAADVSGEIFTMPADGSMKPTKISHSLKDGFFGIALTPDSRLVYQSFATGQFDLAVMNLDGSEGRQLTDDATWDRNPRVTPSGQVVYLASKAEAGPEIRRLDLEGGKPTMLANCLSGSGVSLGPDGRWAYYEVLDAGVPTVWRVPVEGGEPQQLTDYFSIDPAVSPDGEQLAFYFRPKSSDAIKLGIAPIEGGLPTVTFDIPPPPSARGLLKWSDDGKSLQVSTMPQDRANLWRIPLDGGEPIKLTDFDQPRLSGYEVTPDGQTIVYSRSGFSRDAVLIENFR